MNWEIGQKYRSVRGSSSRLWLCHGRCMQNGFVILEYIYPPAQKINPTLAVSVVTQYNEKQLDQLYGKFELVPFETDKA